MNECIMMRTAIFLLCFSVAMGNSMREPINPRQPAKRASSGLTAAEKQEILDCHNNYRRQEGAANMELMTWDDDLEFMAAGWAANCYWDHGQPANAPITGSVGQNILYTTEKVFDQLCDARVFLWYDEKKDYNFNSQSCNAVCGHYTQIVWAETNKVGCAIHQCNPLSNSWGYDPAWYMVCNYLIAGNMMGEDPYKKGEGCTLCAESGWCEDGLCTTKEQSPNAVCNLSCKNCGTMDAAACKCNCPAGWTGLDCSEPCVDTDSYCNNGWYPQYCDEYDYMRKGCPAMCGVCQAATSGTPACGDSGSAPVPAAPSPAAAPAAPPAACSSDQWQCGSGECIPSYYYCDWWVDCADYSDESNCY